MVSEVSEEESQPSIDDAQEVSLPQILDEYKPNEPEEEEKKEVPLGSNLLFLNYGTWKETRDIL